MMGTKTLPDTVTYRIRKALDLRLEFQISNPCEFILLAGNRGLSDIYSLAEFSVFHRYDAARWEPLITTLDDPKWGEFHGLVYDVKVYQPKAFNPNLIELRDVAGQFSYTIDLTD